MSSLNLPKGESAISVKMLEYITAQGMDSVQIDGDAIKLANGTFVTEVEIFGGSGDPTEILEISSDDINTFKRLAKIVEETEDMNAATCSRFIVADDDEEYESCEVTTRFGGINIELYNSNCDDVIEVDFISFKFLDKLEDGHYKYIDPAQLYVIDDYLDEGLSEEWEAKKISFKLSQEINYSQDDQNGSPSL